MIKYANHEIIVIFRTLKINGIKIMNVIPANNVLNNQGSKNYYWILLIYTVQAYENNILISKMYGCAEILLTNRVVKITTQN